MCPHWHSTPDDWISMHDQQNLDDNSSSSRQHGNTLHRIVTKPYYSVTCPLRATIKTAKTQLCDSKIWETIERFIGVLQTVYRCVHNQRSQFLKTTRRTEFSIVLIGACVYCCAWRKRVLVRGFTGTSNITVLPNSGGITNGGSYHPNAWTMHGSMEWGC